MKPDRRPLERVRPEVRECVPDIVRMRRDLHQHPEPGFEEVRTAAKVAEWLSAAEGIRVRTGVARTGVVADIGASGGPGPHILLRADMDALRVEEQNPHLDYRSIHPGVMHACGHDAHTAMLVGVARILARRAPSMKGSVRFVFQPAEEGPGGAAPMIAEGVLADPRPDAALGLHVWSQVPLGHAALRAGPIMADTSELHIKVQGKGGHGASPHETIDPIAAAAQFIVGLQSIVSRNVDPLDSAVLSIGKINGGSIMNAIADAVTLDGTMRSYLPGTRAMLARRLSELAEGMDRSFGTRTTVEITDRYPPLVNEPVMTQMALGVLAGFLGADNIRGDLRVMGGEDMAFYLQQVPGCFIFLGAGNSERGIDHPHHNPRFDIDEDVLPLGVELMLRLVERLQERT
jgi:amidohydrolase